MILFRDYSEQSLSTKMQIDLTRNYCYLFLCIQLINISKK